MLLKCKKMKYYMKKALKKKKFTPIEPWVNHSKDLRVQNPKLVIFC